MAVLRNKAALKAKALLIDMAIFNGDDGDNVIDDTTGNDTIIAGGGNDRITLTGGFDTVDGGTGRDRLILDYAAATQGIFNNVALTGSLAAGYAGGFSQGNDSFRVDFTGIEDFTIITGAMGNDNITTGDGDDIVTVFDGQDVFNAGAGIDTVIVNWGSLTNDVTDPGYAGYAKTYRGAGRLIQTNGVENFHITTGSGNDIFGTGDGDDIVNLGAGNDFVNLFAGNDIADGGDGFDGFSADFTARVAAINFNFQTGTTNAFTNFEFIGTVLGTGYADTIVTGAGGRNEIFSGGEGDDRFTTVDGQDIFEAGGGTDTLVIDWSSMTNDVSDPGYAGYAKTYYGGGRLIQTNGVENFHITTGSGNDIFGTGDGDDIVNLGAGNDFVNLFAGNDIADGGDGEDGFSADFSARASGVSFNLQTGASPGNAFTNFEFIGTIIGTAYADTIVTSALARSEVFVAGDGDDSFTTVNGQDIFDGGAGTDTLIIDWSTLVNDAGDIGYAGYARSYTGGGRLIQTNGVERFIITTGSGNDVISGGAADDIIKLGGGDDFVNLFGGNDVADGGDGIDGFSADFSARTSGVDINLQTGASTGNAFTNFEWIGDITGTAFADTIVTSGVARSESFSGGDGDDSFTTVNGQDIFDGGAGTDTLIIDWSSLVNDASNIGYAGFATSFTGGGRLIRTNGVERFIITTGSGNDGITTGEGDDIIDGGAGDDTLHANGGIDAASYRSAAVGVTVSLALQGSAQNTVGAGIDTLTGFENLIGSGFDDILTGSTGSNAIHGGNGNDLIVGNGGTDVLMGEDGDDALRINASGAASTIDGGAGIDTLEVDGNVTFTGSMTGMEGINLLSGASLTLTDTQFNGAFSASSTLQGTGALTINMTGTEFEFYILQFANLGAPAATVTINGSASDDVIKGMLNHGNIINGGDGGDLVRGGTQADILNGGDGDDKIVGGMDADILTGGAGNDIFRYASAAQSGPGAAADRITDFVSGQDQISLVQIDADTVAPGDQAFSFIGASAFSATGLGQVRYMDSGGDLMVQVDVDGNGSADMEILLNGLAGQALTTADFIL